MYIYSLNIELYNIVYRIYCTQACKYDNFVMHHSYEAHSHFSHSYEAHLFSFFICIRISEFNDVVSSDQFVQCTYTFNQPAPLAILWKKTN